MSTLYRNYKFLYPAAVTKSPAPIKFGILGAAAIAPVALINPAKSHPDVVIVAVGARDKKRAEAFAKKHGITRAYEGYDAVINDPEVDAIYNPLPNSLHFEWTMKALAAGKHVLLEKPSCDTLDETQRLVAFAKEKGVVLLEAFHYRFHPAMQRFKQIVHSGEIGAIKAVSASLAVPSGFMAKDDIRFNYKLGGGATMDMGCYVISSTRYVLDANPLSVLSATPVLVASNSQVDRGMKFTLEFPSDIRADCLCDLALPPWGPMAVIPRWPDVRIKVIGDKGEAEYFNFPAPVMFHSITVKGTKGSRTEKAYPGRKGDAQAREWGGDTGEKWWSTYRFQLESFVDACRGRTPRIWISQEDMVEQSRVLDMVYEKAGLPLRPNSEFHI